jgi:hypothetical protein
VAEGDTVQWFRLKCCVKCGGDLALDQGDWLCLQCGTYYYTGLYREIGLSKRPEEGERFPLGEKAGATSYCPVTLRRESGSGPAISGYPEPRTGGNPERAGFARTASVACSVIET